MTFKLSSRDSQGFRMIIGLARMSPGRTFLIVTFLLLAGLAEGVGVATVLPLLSEAGLKELPSDELKPVDHSDDLSTLEELLKTTFEWIGYYPSFVEILILN